MAVTATLLGVVGVVASATSWSDLVEGYLLAQSVAAVSTAAVGAVILVHLPGHGVGRLFLAIGLLAGISGLASGLAARLSSIGVRGPALSAVAWPAGWLWLPAFLALLMVVLLFPDGRLASPRWRVLCWPMVASAVIATIAAALVRELTAGIAAGAENPIAVAALPDDLLIVILQVATVVVMVGGSVGMVALAVRLVRARGTRRRQLAWFFVAIGLVIAGYASTSPLLATLAVVALPIGLGIAMLRHGLSTAIGSSARPSSTRC